MATGRVKTGRKKRVLIEKPEAENTENESSATSNRIFICGQKGCNDIVTTGKYCRFHYLATWKKTKQDEAKKKGQKLEAYLQDLSQRFPEDFLERLKGEIDEMGLESDKDESSEKSSSFFEDTSESADADVDTIIKGIRIEDF